MEIIKSYSKDLNNENLNKPINKINNEDNNADENHTDTKSILNLTALTERTKQQSALTGKVVECNPVMARCVKSRREIKAASSPYLGIQRQWQKQRMTITKNFSTQTLLVNANPHQSTYPD
jgi:hypothetical protein